ncbi:MAG: 1-acyl-sn-glycerol-3-phosphate acyltransferase [Candidatus Azotimanducaceae bacterium]
MGIVKITPLDHLLSIVSFTFITFNLLIWLPILALAAILRALLPFFVVKRFTFGLVDSVYRIAVRIDGWWFIKVLKLKFVIDDENEVLSKLKSSDNPLIICNHQSWFDVFLLQTIISTHGPILKFLIKAELLWVPVLGWVCIVLNFPRLKRKGDRTSRQRDLQVAQSASSGLSLTPGALLLFPEGTRFSKEKHALQNSQYQSLLQPKPGGFSVIRDSLTSPTMIIDVSIRYQSNDRDCWRCMSGQVDDIYVKVSATSSADVSDSIEWLDKCWVTKDAWLDV